MRLACLLTILLAASIAGKASASTAVTAPTDLHGFMLRAD
jgi:hypothetical protein